MNDITSQGPQPSQDQLEKAAIIAEATFALLPPSAALVARHCVILHWFDRYVVEALLAEDSELTLNDMLRVYDQLETLPFIDTVPWGLAFQTITREGLLKHYSTEQPELLQTSAHLAAPSYEDREEDPKSVIEAFFCYTVAAEQETAIALQNALFEQSSSYQNWQFLDSLFQIQIEAERLPFVPPLPSNELHFLLRGFVHRMQNNIPLALSDYQQAIEHNPQSKLAYISRGTAYAEQKNYDQALSDYNIAINLDRKFAPAYLSRSIVYTQQGKHKKAQKENNKAMKLGMSTDIAYINKGDILKESGYYEDALNAYDVVLKNNPYAIEAHLRRGQVLIERGYNIEALNAFEIVLHLNPNETNACLAYISKAQALNALGRHQEALRACESAIDLNPDSADAYRIQARALSELKCYPEASKALEEANKIESRSINDQSSLTSPENFLRGSRPREKSQQNKPSLLRSSIDKGFAVVSIGIIVVILILASLTPLGTTFIGGGPIPTFPPPTIATTLSLCHTDTLVHGVAWSPNGRFVASATASADGKRGDICIWNPRDGGNAPSIIIPNPSPVFTIAWSPNSRFIASGNYDYSGTIRVWDTSHPTQPPRTFKPSDPNTSTVYAIAWSPNGRFIASGGPDYTVRIWDVRAQGENNPPLATYLRTSTIRSITWSPDSTRLALAVADGTVQIIDAQTGSVLHNSVSHAASIVDAIAWSPDGTHIASGNRDGTVQIWNAQTGALLFTDSGHTGAIGSVAWSPDNASIVTGSNDTTVRIWDAHTQGNARTIYTKHKTEVHAVAWFPTGNVIASGDYNGIVQIWPVT